MRLAVGKPNLVWLLRLPMNRDHLAIASPVIASLAHCSPPIRYSGRGIRAKGMTAVGRTCNGRCGRQLPVRRPLCRTQTRRIRLAAVSSPWQAQPRTPAREWRGNRLVQVSRRDCWPTPRRSVQTQCQSAQPLHAMLGQYSCSDAPGHSSPIYSSRIS